MFAFLLSYAILRTNLKGFPQCFIRFSGFILCYTFRLPLHWSFKTRTKTGSDLTEGMSEVEREEKPNQGHGCRVAHLPWRGCLRHLQHQLHASQNYKNAFQALPSISEKSTVSGIFLMKISLHFQKQYLGSRSRNFTLLESGGGGITEQEYPNHQITLLQCTLLKEFLQVKKGIKHSEMATHTAKCPESFWKPLVPITVFLVLSFVKAFWCLSFFQQYGQIISENMVKLFTAITYPLYDLMRVAKTQ